MYLYVMLIADIYAIAICAAAITLAKYNPQP